MTSITPENLLAELRRAADVVTGVAAGLDDAAVSAPSELPGWTRGHVLAHINGIATAMARQVEHATRGERVELYDGGFEGRNRAIELAAGHGADQHRAAVGTAIDRALAAFGSLDEAGWRAPITFRDGVVLDGGLALWRELTIHATDLGTAAARRPGAGRSASTSSTSWPRGCPRGSGSCCSRSACPRWPSARRAAALPPSTGC